MCRGFKSRSSHIRVVLMQKKELELKSWADAAAQEVLKEFLEAKTQVCAGGWTPSGYFHIGNARPEIFTSFLVHNALEKEGLKSRYIFVVDDYDRLEKIPSGHNISEKKFSEYIDVPLKMVPSPFQGFDSWADYFMDQIKSVVSEYSITTEWVSVYDSYKKGLYNEKVVSALNNSEKIVEIWNKIAGSEKPRTFLPLQVYCSECNKLAQKVFNWNGKTVSYECACGNKEEISPLNGKAKLHWRVDWPSRWAIFNVTFESGGKDHFSPGGSVDVGKEIIRKVFDRKPPVMIGSEFIQMSGKKMAGSKGNVIDLREWLNVASPELLRFLNNSYHPNKVIEFALNDYSFILLNDRFDRAERVFYGLEEAENNKIAGQLKRAYELSVISKPSKKMPLQVSFPFAVMISQLLVAEEEFDKIIELLKSTNHLKGKLSALEEELLKQRLARAKYWVDRYGPEQFRISFMEIVPKELKDSIQAEVKQALKRLGKDLTEATDSDQAQEKVFSIAGSLVESKKEFFKSFYSILIGRSQGPKAGTLIMALGKDKVINRLKDL